MKLNNPGEEHSDSRSEIILIGPVSVGKSTIGNLLCKSLGLQQVSMDQHRLRYYAELGYTEEFRENIFQMEGTSGVYRYWKVFDAYSVERLLQDHSNCVFDMGAGSTVCEFPDELDRVERAFGPFRNVVLLMPSPDRNESLEYLSRRTGWPLQGGRNINRHLINHHSNNRIAKQTVYTLNRTPEEITQEILQIAAETTSSSSVFR